MVDKKKDFFVKVALPVHLKTNLLSTATDKLLSPTWKKTYILEIINT